MYQLKKLWLLPLLCLAACGSSGYRYEDSKSSPVPASEASASADSVSSVAKSIPINSGKRKVIHTVDFNCKVSNVFIAVNTLENLVKATGGIVQESNIRNSESDSRENYYKPDSLKKMTTYTTTATLTLRVPIVMLDSVINAIPALSCFIDSRTIKQSDVTWQYLSNELKNQAGNTRATTTKALALARKSNEPIEVQQFNDEKEEKRTDRKIENLNLLDDVNYATLTVLLAQPEQVFTQIIVNPHSFTDVLFSIRCRMALNNGWNAIVGFLIVLINIWPLLLILIAGLVIYRKLRHRQPVLI